MINEEKSDRVQQLKHTDGELWRRVKAAAVMKDQSMTEWVEELVRKELDGNKKSK